MLSNKLIKIVFKKKMLVILVLGFASGLPLGLTGTTLQAWYAVENIDLVTIGFLALVGQPYVYKFLWAPCLDKLHPLKMGRRRGWIVTTQLGMLVAFSFLNSLSPSTAPVLLGLVALLIAVLSATQDIAIDAYRTEVLHHEERGLGAAIAVAGYRAAMLVSGGLTLVLANYLGFKMTFMICACLIIVTLFVTLWSDEPKVDEQEVAKLSFLETFLMPLQEFFSRDKAIILLSLIVFYKMGDAFAGTFTTAFLLKGVGFSLLDVGAINKTVGFGSTMLGVFIGGFLMMRMGNFKALLWFGILQALTNLSFSVLAYIGHNYFAMVAAIFLENLTGGMGTAAYIALIMSLCHPSFTATQFALLSALSAVGRVFVGPTAGFLVEKLGWFEFFIWTVFFAVPGIILLLICKKQIIAYDNKEKSELGMFSDYSNKQSVTKENEIASSVN